MSFDAIICAGLERETSFPDIGAMEWTYNRMVETLLKPMCPHELRVLMTHFTEVPPGLHVLKHVPLQAHYMDETILQVNRCFHR